jgi:hypothetical protein
MSDHRDRAVDVRLEALKAATKVAKATDGVADLLAHAGWLSQFVETGKAPAVDSSVAGSLVASDHVSLDSAP